MNNTSIQGMFPQVLSVKSLELDVNKISNLCYDLKKFFPSFKYSYESGDK